MLIPRRAGEEQWHRFEELMFRMCLPGSRKDKKGSQGGEAALKGSDRKSSRRESAARDSSLGSTTDGGFTTFTTTASKESRTNNSRESRDSRVSSSSSASSLAGIRDLLPDGPIRYRYKDLVRATDNFSEASKIGGSVFRALVRGADVAIVQKKGSFVGNYIELLKIITSVHHVNLVKVLGACLRESEHVYVCYEYEEGVNLREALHSPRAEGFSALASWTSRLQVALDVALGLEYLHDHTMPPFVHKHVKSTNIIVTNELRAKIVKFGIPQLVGEIPSPLPASATTKENAEIKLEEHERLPRRKLVRQNSIKITGTPGYMSPEYQTSGVVSSKMDVFAFGVVLLELLTGKQPGVQLDPATKKHKVVSLTDEVTEIMEERDPRKKLRLWIDARLRDSYPVDTAMSVTALARLCIDSNPESRPPMKNVTAKLSNYLIKSQEWERDFLAFREQQSQTMEGR
ncbi:chitin elicitor receptor kinase 1 [Selaginella moellendorffii]|uniref:chitin elicitor receptor kinase 1 n=1 Tax=Selaginella moellendorffii TaxID=88036 RepID=UPI000D1C7081|nr:chitin elicitor receptor kinase 1 [Selaginella moellendorffii]|eukprot:XP_024522338.1 chitin elicitor receptor kinase 1 [Selaginella moellendorffii]